METTDQGDSVTPNLSDRVDGGESEKTQETVAYETHKRVLRERKADLEKRKALEAELEAFKEDARKREEAALEEQGKYKELTEHFKNELKRTQAALSERDEMINDGIKLQAFKSKIGGEFKNPKYMSFVDLAKIELREDGTVDEGTLEMTVNSFLKEHGSDLLKIGTGRKMPSDAPRMGLPSAKKITQMDKGELSEIMREKLSTLLT